MPAYTDPLDNIDTATSSEQNLIDFYTAKGGYSPGVNQTSGSIPSAGTNSTASGSSSNFDPNDPYSYRIFVGYKTKRYVPDSPSHVMTGDPELDAKYGYDGSSTHNVRTPQTLTIGQLMKRFDRLSIQEMHNWYRNLLIAGILAGGRYAAPKLSDIDAIVRNASMQEVESAYLNLLTMTADAQRLHPYLTPEEFLRQQMAFRLPHSWDGNLDAFNGGIPNKLEQAGDSGGAGSSGSNGIKPGEYTTTATSIDFMRPEDAKYLVRNMLQQELGRDPTQGEYEDFLAALHNAERQNPTTTTRTDTYAHTKGYPGTRLVDSNTVTHQGITEAGLQQIAYERAQQQPGWAEWQAMGTYAPALFAALGSTVPGV